MIRTSDLVKITFSRCCYEITCMSRHCRTDIENVAVFPVPDCDLRDRGAVNTLHVWTNSTGNLTHPTPPLELSSANKGLL